MGHSPATDRRYDVIVIGVGGVGSAAVYQLARRGVDVLGIEQYDIPHAKGSSHGSTRIVRRAQYEGPSYVPLADRALAEWRTLERRTGRELLHRTGSVFAGTPETDFVDDVRTACDTHDVGYEELSASAVGERFSGYDLPADMEAIYQPDGGFLDCERCVSATVEAAHQEGATIRGRERVLQWSESAAGVSVETARGRYESDELVVAAGSWTGKLVPSVADHLRPVRALMGWLQPHQPELFVPDQFPVFVIRDTDIHGYGFPVHDVPGLKLGRFAPNPSAVDPDTMDRDPTAEEERRLRRLAERFFPAGAGPTLSLRTCLQTFTPDEHFLLGRVPAHERVTVGTGFSGHGFKFASATGDILADLALEGTTEHDIGIHRIDRF